MLTRSRRRLTPLPPASQNIAVVIFQSDLDADFFLALLLSFSPIFFLGARERFCWIRKRNKNYATAFKWNSFKLIKFVRPKQILVFTINPSEME